MVRHIVLLTITIVLLLAPLSTFGSTFTSHQSSSGTSSPVQNHGNVNATSVTVPLAIPPAISESKSLGAVNPSTPVSMGIILPPRNQIGLEQRIGTTSNPLSPEYRHFLTSQQYVQLYGPDLTGANLLSSYLRSNGLSTSFDPSNPDLMLVTGSALSAEKALQVSIQSFDLGGTQFYSATSSPHLPSEFSNIRNVFGLTDYGSASGLNVTATPTYRLLGALGGKPAQVGSSSIYYSPSEIKQAYNVSSLTNEGYTGTGVTIAIVDAFGDPYIQQEVNNFSSEFNLPQTKINQICVDGPCNYAEGVTHGWNTEIALDVEWAHAMAPEASIDLYIGSNNSVPLYDAVQRAVTDGNNSIISLSWGSPENAIASSAPIPPVFGENYPWLDQVFQQAAAEGITVFASTGDWGAYDQSQGQTSPYGGAIYPSTDPYVTAVGGTSLYMNFTFGFAQSPYFNAVGGYGGETAWSWNNFESSATGGGYSTIFGAPSWQKGQGFSGGARGVPDVSWDADPQTGVLVSLYNPSYDNYTYYIVGGTSVGAPSWAGSMALLDQKAGENLGLINPTLYSILSSPAEYSKAFHDITSGNNNPNSATTGWDPVTGLGSPNLGELSNLIAPTGSLAVSVTNTLSNNFGISYSYGSSIGFSATVTGANGVINTGTVGAEITGPEGQVVASNVPLSYDTGTQEWTGTYTIKPTDPAGIWTASISATSGVSSGSGFTTMSVGDGVTIFQPYYNSTTSSASAVYAQVGHTIKVSAMVTMPNGTCCVTSGNFSASFYYNSPSGKLEGSTSLTYNPGSKLWEGSFQIPRTADQGAWIMKISGTDSSGNSGEAYSWMNVGLYMLMTTDSPSYVLGDTIGILFAPLYSNGTIAVSGTFTATVTDGTSLVAQVPMTFSFLNGFWVGLLKLSATDPFGFYTITISGNDGLGNAGTFAMVTRVAQYNLAGQITLPSKEISVEGGSMSSISARISYPNGTLMSIGSAEAYVSLDHNGLLFPIKHIRLTYQASSQSFVGPNVLNTATPLTTPIGTYLVSVQAFDPSGNYANLTTTFFVNGLSHNPITITGNSQFTAQNGVIGGTGTSLDPYLIAGLNTTSISITGNVSESFRLYNNWVEGSAGDGIVLSTPNSLGSSVEGDYAVSNAGNGVVVRGGQNIKISSVDASNNGLNGIVISGLSDGVGSQVINTVASGNQMSGIVVENTSNFPITSSLASYNRNSGFMMFNSPASSLTYDNATSNSVGVNVSGISGTSYGRVSLLLSNIFSNNVGIQVDGLGQTITDPVTSSSVLVADTIELYNKVALHASNDSVVTFETNLIGLNNHAVVIDNSLPLVVNNVIADNNESAIDITGSFLGSGHCQVEFTNSTKFSFSACVALNLLSQNGLSGSTANGLSLSGINGSFVYANVAEENNGDGILTMNDGQSVVSSNFAGANSGNGINIFNTTRSRISANQLDYNLNGMVVSESTASSVDQNNASLNYLKGIVLSQSTGNSVTNNTAIANTVGCASVPGCTIAGGIELADSSNNNVTHNSVEKNTGTGSIGAGIYLSSDSRQNSLLSNNVTGNDAGIVISKSPTNIISNNTLTSNKYGIYFISAPNNTLLTNTFASNGQNLYPTQPIVSFSNMVNGETIRGQFKIIWNATGQEITNETILIDGRSLSVNGDSFIWNSTSFPDGNHTITIQIENAGGLLSSDSVNVSTYNHETILVETVGPGKIPIHNSIVNVRNSTFNLNQTTDSNGHVAFQGLSPGTYTVSTLINGTAFSSTVNFDLNTSVVLFSPTLVTTANAVLPSGDTVPIKLSGNITASQLVNVFLNNSRGEYSLSFETTGQNGSLGHATIIIPKSLVPGGLIPKMMIDGVQANQSFVQDKDNYYINLTTQLGSQNIVIQFARVVTINLRYTVALISVVSLIASSIILVFRRGARQQILQT